MYLAGVKVGSNITLKWGTTDDRDLYDWHRQWVIGDPVAARKNGSIILLDRQGQEKVRWNFFNAWPAKWTGPSFNAEGNDVSIETLELAHEGLERA
jgi:phage tail-like protein